MKDREKEEAQIRSERAMAFANTSDNKKCHVQLTLEYLNKYGSITPLEALNAFGCLRLGARICDLRKLGYEIKTKRNDGKKQFAIYSLDKSEK